MRILVNERLSEHRVKTPEGYLICMDAILARTGKQTYRHNEIFKDSDDESEIEIDRPEVEVFSDKTLASFENKPITDEHPDEDVNVNNYKQHSIGFVRDIRRAKDGDQDVMIGNLVITDKDAIEEIESGERTELSCGYDCEIVDDNGHYIQKNIRGNHVALCEHGRAGNARIIDSNNVDDAQMHTYEICYIDYSEVCIAIVAKSEQDAIRKFRRDYGYYTIVHVKQKDSVNDAAKFYVVICENNDVYIAESIDRAKRLANSHDGDVYEVDGNIEFYRQTLKKFGQRAAFDEWWNDKRKGKARLVDAKQLYYVEFEVNGKKKWTNIAAESEEQVERIMANHGYKATLISVNQFAKKDSVNDARYEYYIIESASGQHLSEAGRLTSNPNDYREVEDRDEAERLARFYSQKLGVQLYVKKDFYIDSIDDAVMHGQIWFVPGEKVWMLETVSKSGKYAYKTFRSKEDAVSYAKSNNIVAEIDDEEIINTKDATSYRGKHISWDRKAIYGRILSENDPLSDKTLIEVDNGRVIFVSSKLLEKAIQSGEARLRDTDFYEGKTFTNKNGAKIKVTGHSKEGKIQFEIRFNGKVDARQATEEGFKTLIKSNGYIQDSVNDAVYVVELYKSHGSDPIRKTFQSYAMAMDFGKSESKTGKWYEIYVNRRTVNGPSTENSWERGYGWYKDSVDDAIVEPDTNDLKGLEKIFEQNGFKVESLRKNLFRGYHYQIRSTQAYPKEKFKETVVQIAHKIDAYKNKTDCSITWNFGHMDDGTITAGVDVHDKYVKDSMKEFIVKHNDRKFKVQATSPKDAVKRVAKLK